MFIICGGPDDIMDLKNGTQLDSDPGTAFLLIDLYKSVFHIQLLFIQ